MPVPKVLRTLNEAQKRRLMDDANSYGLSLNGRPATVCGTQDRFAHIVVDLGDCCATVEISWHALDRALKSTRCIHS